jgi:hypothetical protein
MEWSTLSGLSYIVVDEIEGGMAGLSVSDWPRKDEQGRLRFESEPVQVAVDLARLQDFVDRHREQSRPVRIGDVFAARARPTEATLDPEHWIDPPVHDVTADAREAAKIAFYAAVAPITE